MAIRNGKSESSDFIFLDSSITGDGDWAMKLKDASP